MLLHNLSDGKFVKQFPLHIGTVSSYFGKRHLTEMFYSFTTFLTPGIFYRCDMTSPDLVSTVMGVWIYLVMYLCCGCDRCLGGQKWKGLMSLCSRLSKCFILAKMALRYPCLFCIGRWVRAEHSSQPNEQLVRIFPSHLTYLIGTGLRHDRDIAILINLL